MVYELRIFKGLFSPNLSFYKLAKAEVIEQWRLRVVLVILASAIIFALSGWLGVGSQVLSPTIVWHSPIEYASLRGLFIIGRFLLGLVSAGIFLTLPALCFWMFSEQVYVKFVLIQAILLPILLLEQISYTILAFKMDVPWYSSPLSFGILAQYFTSYPYVFFLFGSISLFKIWVMILQYRGLKELLILPRLLIILLIFSVHLVSWCFTSALSIFNFTNI